MDIKIFLYYMTTLISSLEASIYTDFLTDYMKFHEINATIVTEFSCNKKESFTLLKALMRNGFQSKSVNATPSEVKQEEPPSHQTYILNMECREAHNILTQAEKLQLFLFPYTWIIFFKSENKKDEIFKKIEDYNILVDSNFNVCFELENGTVSLQKIYKNHQSCSFVKEPWGQWTKNTGFVDNGLEKNVARRRADLKGITLNTCIVITHNDSLNHLTDKRDKHIDSITKVSYVLVRHLSNIVNVSLNYSIEGTWGYKNEQNEWSGMMGELTGKRADIGGTPLFFTIDRVDLIDYIAMITPTRSKFVFREPKLSYVTNVYTLPFDDYVWASTISLIAIAAIILFISLKWEHKKRKTDNVNTQIIYPELECTVEEATFFSLGALCQQGAPIIPASISGRITSIMIFISFMFLYTSYSANIVALLQSSSNSIQTLEDLLKSRLEIGVDDTVFNRFYFPNATEPTRKAIYQQKVAPRGKKDHFMTIEEGVNRMRKGLFAFHMETGPGYKLVGEIFHESEKCGLQEIQYLQVIDPWLAIQKNSSYKKLLKIGLRKIQESGLQSREVGLIYTKRPTCNSRGSNFVSVGIVDCYPAAVVLAVGMITSFTVFIIEKIIHYRCYILTITENTSPSEMKYLKETKVSNKWPFLK